MAAATTDNYRLMGETESGSDDMFALDWGGDAGACWEVWYLWIHPGLLVFFLTFVLLLYLDTIIAIMFKFISFLLIF